VQRRPIDVPHQCRDAGLPRQGLGAGGGVGSARNGQRHVQRPARLPEPAAQEPIPGHRVDHPQRPVGLPVPDRAFERPADVGCLAVEALQPLSLRAAIQVRRGPFGKLGVVAVVTLPDAIALPSLVEALQTVVRDGLKQPVPGAAPIAGHDHQRPVYQADQQGEHILGRHAVPGTDGFGGLEGEAVGVHGQPPQHHAFGLGQQVPAPVDRCPERLLSRRDATMPGCQQAEPVVQPRHQLVHAQCPHAGGRELQGQRNAIKSPAEYGHGVGVVGTQREPRRRRCRSCDEELDGTGLLQRWNHEDDLAGEPEWLPAGSQDAQLGRGPQQRRRQFGDRLDHVLAVVQQQQQQTLAPQRTGEPFDQAYRPVPPRAGRRVLPDAQDRHDRLSRRARHVLFARPPEPGQLHQPHPIREPVDQLRGRLHREPGLADPAGAGERDQPS
jgi:hypothetical protein